VWGGGEAVRISQPLSGEHFLKYNYNLMKTNPMTSSAYFDFGCGATFFEIVG
jgi:hypothetical protein